MSISLIKVLSCSIFIANKYNNKILVILLKDYAKTRVNKTQFLFILMLAICYEDNHFFKDDIIYKILDRYIYIHGNKLCKHFLYN